MRIIIPATINNIQEGIKISIVVILNIFNMKIASKISPTIIPVKIKKS